MNTKQTEALKLAQDLRALADRFSEGWHEGIKIDASDIVLLSDAAEALAEQPAPMIRGDIRDGLVDDEPAQQHIEHCLWARNGNQPCPHVQPAQQQEPVGRLESDPYEGHVFVPRIDGDWSMLGKNLYTSPQAQRTWAGLTDEDIKEAEWLLSAIKEHEAYTLQEQLLVEGVDVFARAIEAKLREKNT